MALVKTTAQVIIPNGASLSNPIDLGSTVLCAILIPAGWTAAGLSFQASDDGGTTWFNIFDSTGAEVIVASAAVVAGQRISVDPSAFVGVDFIRVRSGYSAVPVNQTADRTLTLVSVDSAQAVGIKSAASSSGGSGSQTPWTSDIDAAGHNLSNVKAVGIGGAASFGGRPLALSSSTDSIIGAVLHSSGADWYIENRGVADTPNHRLAISSGGSDVFTILPSGAVGIGVKNPAATLDVATGTIRFGGLPSAAPAAGSKQLWYDPADSNRVKFVP